MNSRIVELSVPLSGEDARNLSLGDLVSVTGLMFTGRSRFHIRAIEDGIVPPINFEKINCFFHTGPVMREGENGWEVVSIEPTSSIRFEKYGAAVVRKLGIRTLIGKTTMGAQTARALGEVGGVHLSKIGVCGNQISRQVKSVLAVHFLEELGKTEATWVLEVERFGPFFVDIDARGNNYFHDLSRRIGGTQAAYAQLGIPADFRYTDVSG